jgi:glucose/arabinose dehydrogenase
MRRLSWLLIGGLAFGPDGFLYLSVGDATNGRILKLVPAGSP